MADTRSRGQHVSATDFSLGDNEEDSAGFGVSRPPKKTDQSDRECIYDGRLSTPSVKFMLDTIAKCDPSKTNDKGGFGKVYFYKNKHHVLGIPVAIKEVIIEEKSQKLKMMSTINEKLASRTLHFAIVPLLAMTEDADADKRAFYFLSPYLENGDLFQMLKDDNDKLKTLKKDLDNLKGETDKLTQKQTEYQTLQKTLKKRRLKILYHISSALDFLHTPVKGIRGAIIHMDVKSLNIVLDADFNARLIDFGLAREMNEVQSGIPVTKTEVVGTDGYFPTRGYSVLTKYEDYHNFGVVGLECLTGLPPHGSTDKDLRVLHKSKLEDKIQQLWCLKNAISPEAKNILQLCIKCIASPNKKDVSSEEIMNDFLNHLRTFSVPRWDRKNKVDNKCEICLINPPVTDDLLSHASNCHCNTHVCIACIRNSYVNKIRCHSCDADIFPTIGHFWVALLIAGNDVKSSQAAESFLKDIRKVQKLIVSMCPLFIGIRPEDVFVIHVETSGQNGNLKKKLISAVEELSKRDNIKTIFVYYSGHSTKDGLDLENNDDYLSKDEFIGYMKQIVNSKQSDTSGECRNLGTSVVSQKRFLCFLDCCYPPNLTQLFDPRVTVIQVNASRSWQESKSETDGSIFTSFFIQALTRGAYGKKCVLDGCDCLPLEGYIITVQQVIGYIRSHIKRYQQRRGVDTDNAPEKNEIHVTLHDEKIAYNIDFLIQLEFIFRDYVEGREMMRKKIQPHYISDMNELTKCLFSTFMEKRFPDMQLEEGDIVVYQEGICIEIDMGSKKTEELDTLERVLRAWSAKRDLIVTLRHISNIMRGMVLIHMNPGQIQEFLESNGTVDDETCVYPVEGSGSYSIPYAAINVLRENIGRDTEGELQEFKSCLSDILDACKLEDKEGKDGSLLIILSKSGEKRDLPFVCFKVTVFDKISAENSLGNEDTSEQKGLSGNEETTEPKGLLDSVNAPEAKGLKDIEDTTKPKEHVGYKESTGSKGLKEQTETTKQKDLLGNKGRKEDLLAEHSRVTPRQEIIYERKQSASKDNQKHQYESKDPSESFQNPLDVHRRYQNRKRTVQPASDYDRRVRYQPIEASEEIPEYRMDRDPRGFCVIINNKKFRYGNMPKRKGSERDVDAMKTIFSELKFIVKCFNDLTADEIMECLMEFACWNHSTLDCFVCAIMSHGEQNSIFGVDGKLVKIEDVTSGFTKSRTLAGKPKIFFIQACQGSNMMTGAKDVSEDSDHQRMMSSTWKYVPQGGIGSPRTTKKLNVPRQERPPYPSDDESVPLEADFLLGYCTAPGYVSFRNLNEGSWYISKLCETLGQLAHKYDLLTILTEVNRKVASMTAETGKAYSSGSKQIPAPVTTLRKLVFFREPTQRSSCDMEGEYYMQPVDPYD